MTDHTPSRFSGMTAIVTGAGSGIGHATAIRLVAEGARVVGTDISRERLEQVTVGRVLAAADGRVDALVNVAGIMDGFLTPHEMDDAVWDRVMAVNVTAIMRLTRAVLPLMRSAGHGSIVNVSSEAGLRGSAAGAAYTTSKYAVIGFTRSTSFFYAPEGIRCNAVAPAGSPPTSRRPSGRRSPAAASHRTCS